MANISKVILPSTDEYDIKDTVARNGLNGKQDTLVSGTNIKTINNTSLLGSGNINISGSDSDIFVAEYDVTTYAELLAAINADKRIIINHNNRLFFVNYILNLEYEIQLYATGYNCYASTSLHSIAGWLFWSTHTSFTDENSNYSYTIDFNNCYYSEVRSYFYQGATVFIEDSSSTLNGVGLIISWSENIDELYFTALFCNVDTDKAYKVRYKLTDSNVCSVASQIELQDKLVSGTSIKTINNNSLLGNGNIAVQEPLVSGTNIKTINDTSLLGSGNITIGGEDNVQSDWNQTNTSADDYIKNKPTIPVVDQTYDATSTNAQSGVAVASAISDSDNVFMVEPNVTTYNELLQAIEDEKTLYVVIVEPGSTGITNTKNILIDYIMKSEREESLAVRISGIADNRNWYWTVDSKNRWASGYKYIITQYPGSSLNISGDVDILVGRHYKINGQNLSAADVGAATPAYVDSAIAALPEPMIFKGSLGTDGTITTLPAASSSNEGFVYKVITAGTYASQAADVGDTFISDGSNWVLIPSGDEPSGTVTSIATGSGLSGGPITSSGTISLDTAYGDTVNPYGSKTANYVLAAPNGSNGTPSFRALVADDIPSITKSKISDFPSSMPASDVSAWAKASTKPTYTASEVGASIATNWLNGSQTGSVRTSGSQEEDSGYIIGSYAVSEGYTTQAKGTASHAEGYNTEARGYVSHSEGENSIANGDYSHVEGYETVAEDYSHAEGEYTVASGQSSHAEGYYTTANGYASHSEGYGTIASGTDSHVQGQFNIEDPSAYEKTIDSSVDSSKTYYTLSNGKFSKVSSPTTSGLPNYYEYTPRYAKQAFIIGNGSDDSDRSNALTVDWNGEVELFMDVSGVNSSTHIATGGTDKDLWNAIVNMGWYYDVLA